MRFAGRTAVVTGAAHGIGAAVAERLAVEGADIVVADIDLPAAQAVADRIGAAGGSASAHRLDVSLTREWTDLREALARSSRTVSIVVNNAYTLVRQPAHEMSEPDWDRQLAVDLSAVYHSVRAFMPDLLSARGNVVNVSSVHANRTLSGHAAYAAAKGGVLALSRQLALEYGPRVRVNAVIPGPIRTAAWDGIDEAEVTSTAEWVALNRIGDPGEVAAAVAFLASDDASYVTAAELLVDGGQSARILGS